MSTKPTPRKPTAAQERFLRAIIADGGVSDDAMHKVGGWRPVNTAIEAGWATVEPVGDETARIQHRITEDGYAALGIPRAAIEQAVGREVLPMRDDAQADADEAFDAEREAAQMTPHVTVDDEGSEQGNAEPDAEPAEMVAESEARPTVRLALINRGTGRIEVHKPGCRDLRMNGEAAALWHVDAHELKDVVLDVYPPADFEYDEADWDAHHDDIDVMACAPAFPADGGEQGDTGGEQARRKPLAKGKPEELVMAYLSANKGTWFSPYAIGKAVAPEGCKPLGVRDLLARLASAGTVQKADDAVKYRLAA